MLSLKYHLNLMQNFVIIFENLLNSTKKIFITKNTYFIILNFKCYNHINSDLSFHIISHLNFNIFDFVKVDINFYSYLIQKLPIYLI